MNLEKNWLIRTKSNHILGPISREKAIELFKNGSIKSDDEVCSGNGFWFFIREEDMVKRYLTGNEIQGFNPISEAKDVLTQTAQSADQPQEDITLMGSLNTSMLKNFQEPAQSMSEASSPSIVLPKPQPVKKKIEPAEKAKPVIKKAGKKPGKQSYLFILTLLGLVSLFFLLYFRKTIIHKIFQGEVTFSISPLLNQAHAQEVLPEKKKSF